MWYPGRIFMFTWNQRIKPILDSGVLVFQQFPREGRDPLCSAWLLADMLAQALARMRVRMLWERRSVSWVARLNR